MKESTRTRGLERGLRLFGAAAICGALSWSATVATADTQPAGASANYRGICVKPKIRTKSREANAKAKASRRIRHCHAPAPGSGGAKPTPPPTTTTPPPTTTTPPPTTTTPPPTTTTPPPATPPPAIPTCNLTLNSGANLGPYENNSAYQNKVICLNDGNYTLTATQHTAGVKIYALHPLKAKVWGWIEAYGAGEEWHGVSFNNCTAYSVQAGGCSNPGFSGGTPQGMQVYADNFVFTDGELTNNHTAGGWFLGRPGQPIQNLLIARNKMHDMGKLPGGTGDDHVFYADNASGQITDNTLWGNIGYAIQFYPYASNLHFDYNLIDHQQEACAILASSGTGNTFKRDICVSTPEGVTTCCNNASGGSAGQSWFWNVSSPYSGSNYTRTGGDGSGDPGFVDYANHDYRLRSGAPATGYGPRL